MRSARGALAATWLLGIFLFVAPMLLLVLATLYFDKDFLIGIYVTLGATAAYILATRMMSLHDTFDTVIDGFKTMIEPLGVLSALRCRPAPSAATPASIPMPRC